MRTLFGPQGLMDMGHTLTHVVLLAIAVVLYYRLVAPMPAPPAMTDYAAAPATAAPSALPPTTTSTTPGTRTRTMGEIQQEMRELQREYTNFFKYLPQPNAHADLPNAAPPPPPATPNTNEGYIQPSQSTSLAQLAAQYPPPQF